MLTRTTDDRVFDAIPSLKPSTSLLTEVDFAFATFCSASQNSSSRLMLVRWPLILMLRFLALKYSSSQSVACKGDAAASGSGALLLDARALKSIGIAACLVIEHGYELRVAKMIRQQKVLQFDERTLVAVFARHADRCARSQQCHAFVHYDSRTADSAAGFATVNQLFQCGLPLTNVSLFPVPNELRCASLND
jgi:hypothetical protein